MYEKGQALKKAEEIIISEVEKTGQSLANYDHNKFDLFQMAGRYSDFTEILDKHKLFVMYNLWAAELFFEGRQIEKELTQILGKTIKIKSSILNFIKLKRKLLELIDVEKNISAFQDDIYELQNCITATGIGGKQGLLSSTSQIASSVQESETRIYDLVMYKLNTINTKVIGWIGIFVGICAVAASIIQMCNSKI